MILHLLGMHLPGLIKACEANSFYKGVLTYVGAPFIFLEAKDE